MYSKFKFITLTLMLALALASCANLLERENPSSTPSLALKAEDFVKANRLLANGPLLKALLNDRIDYHWLGQGEALWYRLQVPGGQRYIEVDTASGRRQALFDHQQMAQALSAVLGAEPDPGALPITVHRRVSEQKYLLSLSPGDVSMNGPASADNRWLCDLQKIQCLAQPKVQAKESASASTSPDGRYRVLAKAHNLVLMDLVDSRQRPLTRDGAPGFAYGLIPESAIHSSTVRARGQSAVAAQVRWAPNGKKFVSYRADERHINTLTLAQSVPDDGSFRPKIHRFRRNLVGEAGYRLHLSIFDVESGRRIPVDYRALTGATAYRGPIDANNIWWHEDGSKVYLLDVDSSYRRLTLVEVDAQTGSARILLEESDARQLLPGPPGVSPLVRVLSNGDIVWFSERSGWGHLYLYDGESGQLKHAITQGEYLVRDILRIDEDLGWIYFAASGKEAEVDVYYKHIYRARLTGSPAQLLSPEAAHHEVSTAPLQASGQPPKVTPGRGAFSPSGAYFIDRYSTPQNPGAWVLRGADGRFIRTLANIRMQGPEPLPQIETFKVKSADGQYDLYGVLIKPHNFDPQRRYPVVDSIYPGPQSLAAKKTFKGVLSNGLSPLSLTDLGFVVVAIDGRGTGFRSKAFRDHSYGQADQAGNLEDHVAALRQLAAQRPYLDLQRVGIYGMSGGGFAAAKALFDYPDLYKVGVAASGNHDWRLYSSAWGERWHGPADEADYGKVFSAANVEHLRGKLLLMHGEMDDNVHPANTLRVVDALIKANKRFDMLILPSGGHGAAMHPYFQRLMQYYFVEHLAGVGVPEGADLPPTKP